MTPESYDICSSRQWMGLQESSVGFCVCFSLSSTPLSNTLTYGLKSKPVKHRWKHPQVKSNKEDVEMPLYCWFDCWVSSTEIRSSFGGLASWEEQAPAGPLLAPYETSVTQSDTGEAPCPWNLRCVIQIIKKPAAWHCCECWHRPASAGPGQAAHNGKIPKPCRGHRKRSRRFQLMNPRKNLEKMKCERPPYAQNQFEAQP